MPLSVTEHTKYSRPLNNTKVRGNEPLRRWKSTHNSELILHTHGSSVHMKFPIHRFNQPQLLYCCSFYYCKCLPVSGPVQFKPMLFKDQMYLHTEYNLHNTHNTILIQQKFALKFSRKRKKEEALGSRNRVGKCWC